MEREADGGAGRASKESPDARHAHMRPTGPYSLCAAAPDAPDRAHHAVRVPHRRRCCASATTSPHNASPRGSSRSVRQAPSRPASRPAPRVTRAMHARASNGGRRGVRTTEAETCGPATRPGTCPTSPAPRPTAHPLVKTDTGARKRGTQGGSPRRGSRSCHCGPAAMVLRERKSGVACPYECATAAGHWHSQEALRKSVQSSEQNPTTSCVSC